MFLLYTNVVSELMRPSPAPAVEAWVASHPVKNLFFSAACSWAVRLNPQSSGGWSALPRPRHAATPDDGRSDRRGG